MASSTIPDLRCNDEGGKQIEASRYDESSKVVVHFPCLGCLQIIVWMCVFLLF